MINKLTYLDYINQSLDDMDDSLNISFEFFPPNNAENEKTLWHSIEKFKLLQPKFVSVTYGANASTRDRTHHLISKIKASSDLNVVPHLTCIGETTAGLKQIAENYQQQGIDTIMALRGDFPVNYQGDRNIYAADLIKILKDVADFNILVAAYPEVHPEATSPQADLIHLKQKVDLGAKAAITQAFFNIDTYLRFRDRCLRIGIEVEIIPGILPIYNYQSLLRFAQNCNIKIPTWLHKRFDGLDNEPEIRMLVGASIAIDMVRLLQQEGIKDFHFYTLNRHELSYAICHVLGYRPKIQTTT